MADRIDWYMTAKFGLFIHWGAYSVEGVEASWPIMAPRLSEAMFKVPSKISEPEYLKLPSRFNPQAFDARAWVQCARDAGMRYIVLTSKHHDGFCMFDAPGTDYRITNTPYGRDICRELADACSELSMPLGFYYSPPDMHHPGYRDTSKPITANWTGEPQRKEWSGYLDYMESHIRKLLTDYGPVRVLWFDGLANHGKYDPARFHKLIRELSPDTLINDRLGEGFDFVTPEQFIPRKGIPARTETLPSGMDPGGDGFFRSVNFLFKLPVARGIIKRQMEKYNSGELELSSVHQERFPSPERFQPWETCMTIGSTWAYNPDETEWKSPGELIRKLVSVAAKGGNYLLNVGPSDKGLFPAQATERLQYVGNWLRKYGDAVYRSTYTPLPPQDWGRATRTGDKVHLFVFQWPTDGRLKIDPFPGEIRKVSLFSGETLSHTKAGDTLGIDVPQDAPDPDVSVLTVDIGGSESAWTEYSEPADVVVPASVYIRKNAWSAAKINAIGNGVLAVLSYVWYHWFSYAEVARDIFITVAIIAFLNAWILICAARGEFRKRAIRKPCGPVPKIVLFKRPVLRALLITVGVTALLGGTLNGLIYLVSPQGLNNWVYVATKTLYTGLTAAAAVVTGVRSVVRENRGGASG